MTQQPALSPSHTRMLTLAYSTEDVNGVEGRAVPGSRALRLPDEPAGPEGTVGTQGGGGHSHGES